MAALVEMKQELRRFRHDPPGRRFENHHDRMKHRSRALAIARVALGIVLVAAGIAMLFVPGPGLIVIVFGLALFAGQSQRLAKRLDRAEPRARALARSARRRWRTLPKAGQAALIVVGAAVAAGVLYAMVRWLAG